jgi:hypothetical protein
MCKWNRISSYIVCINDWMSYYIHSNSISRYRISSYQLILYNSGLINTFRLHFRRNNFNHEKYTQPFIFLSLNNCSEDISIDRVKYDASLIE